MQHRNIELHSCISSESRQSFKRVFFFKQINVITGIPLERRTRGIAPFPPTLNPTLAAAMLLFQSSA